MSPKARFNASPDRRSFLSQLVVNPTFLDAIDSALLQYGETLDDQQAAAVESGVRQKGAREFVKVLLNLSKTIDIPPRPDHDNLKRT